jgi:hypothetical protein
MDMRRYLVMEQSAPMPLNAMMTNIENNGAPWQYNQQDRLNWKTKINFVKFRLFSHLSNNRLANQLNKK